MGRIQEHNMLAGVEKKHEKQTQQEGGASEELCELSKTMDAENDTEMGKEGKTKKKKKISAENDTEMGKEGKSKKKKKIKMTNEEDVFGSDFRYDTIRNKAVNVKDHVEVLRSSKTENGQKNRKSELKRDGTGFDKHSKKHGKVGGEATEVNKYSDVKFHEGREKNRSLLLDGEKNIGESSESRLRKDKKKRQSENTGKDGSDSTSCLTEITKQNKKEKDRTLLGQKLAEKEDAAEVKNGEGNRTKKIKKGNRDSGSSDVDGKDKIVNTEDIGEVRKHSDGNIMEKVLHEKKEKKRKKKKDKDDVDSELGPLVTGSLGDKSILNVNKKFVGVARSTTDKKRGREIEASVGMEDNKKQKRKKVKPTENVSGGLETKEVPTTGANIGTTDLSEKHKPKKTHKRVKFSDHVEVFPSSDGQEGLVRGRRFSPEEDEMVRKAVFRYIEDHQLGEEGLNKILNRRSHPEVKGCWKEIGTALPWRPSESISYRAHVIFERDERPAWSPEDCEVIKKFHEKHGSEWKMLAEALGKHRIQVKDTWRRIRFANRKSGPWSQDEYQTLFDLVNLDLRMRAVSEERKSKHGMLRDNIGWEAISQKLATRVNSSCCLKWYRQLTSPMVIEGKWSDADDYRLMDALFNLDACCMEDVDWDNLLDHRSGELCRKRWDQMIRYIGHYKDKSFAEQVELLSQRYCPHLLEAREAWDAKVPVD